MMAGFGKTVEVEKAVKEAKDVVVQHGVEVSKNDPYAYLRREHNSLVEKTTQFGDYVALAGHEGSCKSGVVIHGYVMRPDANPLDEFHIVDFDTGGEMLQVSQYPDEKGIVSWDPWVMSGADRTAYDYPGTHQRTMDLMKYFVSIAEKQHDPEYKGKRVWGVLICGVDLWDSICVNNMRIVDLGLAKDGIDAADNRGAGKGERVGHQWDWAVRKTRFHQLTAMSRKLVKLGVNVYWETHLRMTNYSFGGNEDNAKWRPDWEKSSNNYVPTIIIMESEEEYDDDNNLVKTSYYGRFEKCKSNPRLQNQRFKVFETKTDDEPVWYGLAPLFTGDL